MHNSNLSSCQPSTVADVYTPSVSQMSHRRLSQALPSTDPSRYRLDDQVEPTCFYIDTHHWGQSPMHWNCKESAMRECLGWASCKQDLRSAAKQWQARCYITCVWLLWWERTNMWQCFRFDRLGSSWLMSKPGIRRQQGAHVPFFICVNCFLRKVSTNSTHM